MISFGGSFKDSRAETSLSSIKRAAHGEVSVNHETERSSVRDSQMFGGTRSFVIPGSSSNLFGKKYSLSGAEDRFGRLDSLGSAVDGLARERGIE